MTNRMESVKLYIHFLLKKWLNDRIRSFHLNSNKAISTLGSLFEGAVTDR